MPHRQRIAFDAEPGHHRIGAQADVGLVLAAPDQHVDLLPGLYRRDRLLEVLDPIELDLAAFRDHLHRQLPPYARPLFLRIRHELEITGTFKQRKVTLVEEGFDPGTIADKLYFDHPESGRFEPLTAELRAVIQSGSLRL